MLSNAQIQRIYGMGSALGLLENDNHRNDLLHTLIYGLTGKDSVKKLNDSEYKIVVNELATRITKSQSSLPPNRAKARKTKKHQDTAKGMTEGQQRKVWYLMYKLAECDVNPSTDTLGKRLCGIIKKELHIDAVPDKPFVWLGFDEGSKLIEVLKVYVKSAERKAMKGS